MNQYAVNPQTGEVSEFDGQAWKPLDKSRVAKNANGELRVFDGQAWKPITTGSPLAAEKIQAQPMDEARAYDPTFMERMKDLLRADRTATNPPHLPNDAGLGLQALDWMRTFGQATDTAARGMTLGLADEAAGLGAGVGASLPGSASDRSFGEAFKTRSDAVNLGIADFKEKSPTAGLIFEGAGLLTSPASRLGQSWQEAGPTIFSRALRGGTAGAALGGTTAAAYNEGDLTDRAGAAAFGAGTGGALGFLLPPLIESGTKGWQSFWNTYQARKAAANDPSAQARALLQKAIDRDRMTPIPGEGEALAAAGGPNVQALARQSTVAPGTARASASDYYAGAAADMPDAIGAAVKSNISGKSYLGTLDDLTKQQQTVAGPLYDAAYKANQSIASSELDKILATPAGKSALRKAATMLQNDRTKIGITDAELTALVRELSDRGAMEPVSGGVASGLKLRGLDYVKRALDSEYEVLARAGNKTEAGIILGLKNDLVKELDRLDATGLYARARAEFAGPASFKKAAEAGTKAFSAGGLTSEKIAVFNALSPAEQNAFRIGLAEAAIEKAGRIGPNTDPVQVFLNGKNARDLMRTYLPDQESFDAFVRTLQQQSRVVKSSRTVMGGSPTARIEADKAAALEDQLATARDIWNMATGGVGTKLSSFTSAVQKLRDKAGNYQRGLNENVANELGALLFNPSAAKNADLLKSLGSGAPGIFPRGTDPSLGLLQLQRQKTLGLFGPATAAPAGAGIGGNY